MCTCMVCMYTCNSVMDSAWVDGVGAVVNVQYYTLKWLGCLKLKTLLCPTFA